MSLSNKQRAFIREYIVDWNATQAAIRAGYSVDTARQQGSRLLTNVDILAEVDTYIMSAEEAANILTDIARGDVADLMALNTSGFSFELARKDDDGNLVVNPKTKLIKSIDQTVTTILSKKKDGEDREIIRTKLELYSKHEAARDILKYRGKLVDKTEVTGKDGEPLIPVELVNGMLKKVYGNNGDPGA